MHRKILITSALVTSLTLAACAPKAPKELPPAPTTTTTTTTPPVTTPAGPMPGSQEDFVASVTSDTIHFDTDRYNVDVQSQAILQSQAQWLARYPDKKITLEGHCDERGTRDYNIALGERRANAAKNYLASLGVDPSRIQVISYGKERPAEMGSTEEAYAKNRRAVTVVIAR